MCVLWYVWEQKVYCDVYSLIYIVILYPKARDTLPGPHT